MTSGVSPCFAWLDRRYMHSCYRGFWENCWFLCEDGLRILCCVRVLPEMFKNFGISLETTAEHFHFLRYAGSTPDTCSGQWEMTPGHHCCLLVSGSHLLVSAPEIGKLDHVCLVLNIVSSIPGDDFWKNVFVFSDLFVCLLIHVRTSGHGASWRISHILRLRRGPAFLRGSSSYKECRVTPFSRSCLVLAAPRCAQSPLPACQD